MVKQSKSKDILYTFGWFDVINIAIIALIALLVLFPLYIVLINSLSSYEAVFHGKVWFLPVKFTFENYAMVFREEMILMGYKNTITYTFIGTLLSIFLTFTSAYVLSRKDFKSSGLLIKFFTITMFVSGGMIPTYIVVDSLYLTETIWGFILPGCLSVWNVILVRTYMRSSIPYELTEAGMIDGCSDVGLLVRIILPLCKPVMAIMVLFYAVGYWNSYYNALLYLKNMQNLYPLQMILNKLIIQNNFEGMLSGDFGKQGLYVEALKYTTIIVSCAPILIVFPFLQRFFTKGLMAGSLKG